MSTGRIGGSGGLGTMWLGRATAAFVVVILAMAGVPGSLRAQVTVRIYNKCNGSSCSSATGSGAPYSGLVGSFLSPDIAFGAATSFNWHPFKQAAFGADITGNLTVPANGIYTFSVNSDDGTKLFIDGYLVVDDGGSHVTNTATASTALGAGVHSFELQHFEEGTLGSGVDLVLPCSLAYAYPSGVHVNQVILPSTGLDGSGSLLRPRGFDAKWTVDPQKGLSTVPAQVVKPGDADWYSGWITDGPNSQWIARNATILSNGPAPYSFHLPFSSNAMTSATLSMRGVWTIDDQGTLNLNGHEVSSLGSNQWGSLNPFLVPFGSGDFVAGTNQLSMTITSDDNMFEGARFEGCLTPKPVTVLPPSLAFGIESVGKQTPSKTVMVTNNQTGAVTLSHTFTGNTSDFPITGTTCGASLAALAKCTFSFAFKPTMKGNRSATLSVTASPDSTSPHPVSLSGTGG